MFHQILNGTIHITCLEMCLALIKGSTLTRSWPIRADQTPEIKEPNGAPASVWMSVPTVETFLRLFASVLQGQRCESNLSEHVELRESCSTINKTKNSLESSPIKSGVFSSISTTANQ